MIRYEAVDNPKHPRIEEARELFLEYSAELGVDLCFQDFQAELDRLPEKYAPPRGTLLLAFDQGLPVACGALRDLGHDVCELKRIYVRPPHRGRGIARELSNRLMEHGRQSGFAIAKLDTLRRLTGAIELYRSLGFVETSPYNYNPEPDIVYMERPLRPA